MLHSKTCVKTNLDTVGDRLCCPQCVLEWTAPLLLQKNNVKLISVSLFDNRQPCIVKPFPVPLFKLVFSTSSRGWQETLPHTHIVNFYCIIRMTSIITKLDKHSLKTMWISFDNVFVSQTQFSYCFTLKQQKKLKNARLPYHKSNIPWRGARSLIFATFAG